MEQTILPIDVISMCSADGSIRPLRFRMEDETHQLMRIDIDEIVNVRKVQLSGIEAQIFLCKAMVKGKSSMLELRYMIRTHCWSLLRKVY